MKRGQNAHEVKGDKMSMK